MEKVDAGLLLGLDKLDRKKDAVFAYVHICSGTSQHGIRLCFPCVVSESAVEKNSTPKVVFPFAQKEGYWCRDTQTLKQHHITRINTKLDPKKVTAVKLDRFPKKAFSMIVDGAKSNGIMSFFMSPKVAWAFLKNLGYATEMFRYHTVYAKKIISHRDVLYSDNDIVLPVLTVFDLPYCSPIFNSRRVDGIGFNFELVLPRSCAERGKICSFACLSMIFTQYKDNVFCVDGVGMINRRVLSGSTVNDFISLTKTEIKSGKGKMKDKDTLGY